MKPNRRRAGYTLVELLVVIAVIALVAGIALPMYGAQMDSARSVKVQKHFGDAVRVARQEFVKHSQKLGIGEAGSLPTSTADWILLFDGDGSAVAPGGGDAFIATAGGDGLTGAIGVEWDDTHERLTLSRPAYVGLAAAQAELTAEDTLHTP
jgi:prepilin-type N-terminal cleavage/methylation domain-containing protein